MFYLEQTFLLTQVFVHLPVQVLQSLLHLFARILFDDLTQLLFVEGQLVADFLLADALRDTGLNAFKEMLWDGQDSVVKTQLSLPLNIKDLYHIIL